MMGKEAHLRTRSWHLDTAQKLVPKQVSLASNPAPLWGQGRLCLGKRERLRDGGGGTG